MRLPGIGSLRRAAHSIRNRSAPKVLILEYHRIADLESDPYLLCVTPRHFGEHLRILKKYGYAMQLQQVSHALRDRKLPHRGIVMTFDDGYDDTLNTVKPLLDRYDMPATVFVVTGHIGHPREFWWDELERLLLQPQSLPETLRLRINGNLYQWDTGEATNYNQDEFQRNSGWNFGRADDPTLRHCLFRSLYQLLHFLPKEQQWNVLDVLLRWAGAKEMVRPTHRTLSREEVVRLAAGGLVEIGAHTVTHPVLSAIPLDAQMHEIRGSKIALEEILGGPTESFSYPHGLKSHYTMKTVSAVQEAGFVCACSSFAGVIRSDTDRFQLPRIVVQDWDGEVFEGRIKKWLSN